MPVQRIVAQLADVAGGYAGIEADLSHSGSARTRSYDVNVPFMQLERRGWDIHAVSMEPDRGESQGLPVTETFCERNRTRDHVPNDALPHERNRTRDHVPTTAVPPRST